MPRTADHAILVRSIDELEEHARLRREDRVLQLLVRLVPEYRRSAHGRAPPRHRGLNQGPGHLFTDGREYTAKNASAAGSHAVFVLASHWNP